MKNFESSVSIFCRASSKAVALFCLLAVVIFTLPVGAQNGLVRNGRSGKSSDFSASAQYAPLTDPVIWAYDQIADTLISFNASTPDTIISEVPLTGINSTDIEILEFIDFRPSNGVLYAVATVTVTQVSRVVTVNTTTGAVTTVGSGVPPFSGLFFGGDFNPAANTMRQVSRTTQGNRRLDPDAGTVLGTDATLSYASGDPNFGVTPNVVHLAYSNIGPTGPTAYGIDMNTDSLVRIGSFGGTPISPNSGQLFTIGSLGVNTLSYGGFDIERGTDRAYAALLVDGLSQLYSIDLATGAASLIGPIGGERDRIDGLSISLGSSSADLSITKTDGFGTYVPGSVRPYTITATNAGPDPVAGATVTDTMTAQFSAFSWTCSGAGGGVCPASGTGSINALVNIPVGGSVTFQLNATVATGTSGNLVNNASITAPSGVVDSNGANSAASDSNTLLTTSAGVMVSGRVMTPDGRGLRGAPVTIRNSDGVATTVITSSLGYYTFNEVEPGGTYVVGVGSRRYRFTSRVIQVADNLTDVDFIGME